MQATLPKAFMKFECYFLCFGVFLVYFKSHYGFPTDQQNYF